MIYTINQNTKDILCFLFACQNKVFLLTVLDKFINVLKLLYAFTCVTVMGSLSNTCLKDNYLQLEPDLLNV